MTAYKLTANTERGKNPISEEFDTFSDAIDCLAKYAKKHEWTYVVAEIKEYRYDNPDDTRVIRVLRIEEENGVP